MKPLLTLFVIAAASLQFVRCADEPPAFGYENLPVTGFSCDGKLPGRYYADPETDCQMFHVCVKMSKREIQDFKFLCPNGTVFDQEHLVCADFYQVACHSNPQSSTFGHIFEFLKLSASKSDLLDYGKVPAHDPEYLGRNTLGSDDFQVEEYNNNKLAAQGNAIYNAQNARNKEIKFPTTTTRKAVPTTTTTYRPAPTTTASPYFEYQPIASTGAPASVQNFDAAGPTYQVDNVNFHSETSVPDLFPLPTTTAEPLRTGVRTKTIVGPITPDAFPAEPAPNRRPEQAFSGNFNRNSFATNYNSPTYAPPETTSTTTTRRPQTHVFQSTFRTFEVLQDATQRPLQQQTFQQQSTQFSDEYFRRLPTTQQSTTQRIQQLFYGSSTFSVPASTAAPRTFPPPTVAPVNRNHPNYYAVDEELAYLPQGRSVNSDSARNRYEEQPLILNLPRTTPAPSTTAAPVSTTTQEYFAPIEVETTPEPSVGTTTTLAPPASLRPGARRGGRRRLNPNRQRNGAQGGRPRNFDQDFKYSRRVETSRLEHRERVQKTEEIFNAEASVYRGEPNNDFATNDAKPIQVQTSEAPVKKTNSFGGENYGRRIRPNGKPFGSEDGKVITRPDGTKVIKRLRQKSTTEPSTTIAYEVPAFSTTPAFKPLRTGVRTKTIVGPITPDAFPSGDGKRRIIVKKLRPKTTTTTVTAAPTTESTFEPELITSSTERYYEASTPSDVYTTFRIEEITTAAPPKAFEAQQPTNFSATVGGFKVTVISRSSDSETSTSNAEIAESTTTGSTFQKPKATFPKLNKKLISGQQQKQQVSTTTVVPEGEELVGSTKSPDYDYHYFNTDDESQYVAEDRHYGDKRRNKKQVKKVEEAEV